MATKPEPELDHQQFPEEEEVVEEEEVEVRKLLCSFLGFSFSVFLALLPRNALSLVPKLQRQTRDLSARLYQAEEQLRQMKARRKEDSKANARVVEIFASHRNAWQAEEKRLLHQIDAAHEELAHLKERLAEFEKFEEEAKARMEDLEREVGERDEMIGFMSRRVEYEAEEYGGGDGGREDLDGCRSREYLGGVESGEWSRNMEEMATGYGRHHQQLSNGFSSDFLASASKCWAQAEKASLWQDVQCESLEPIYHMKQFVARRECPWKVDSDSAGVSSKLKQLEQELLNLEKIGGTDLSKVPSLMRKQAKRYQALSGKIDDLCRRMQASDPSEPTLSPEFKTQRLTEFFLEASRLQQRATETGQKLVSIQTDVGKSYHGDELGSQAKLTTKRSLDSIRNNFRGIQRNLEIWLARITGDLEGIRARDGASRVREYYMSRYPFVQ